MKSLLRFALTLGAAALFASCGGSQSPIVVPAPSAQTLRAGDIARHSRTTSSYQVLHRFGGLRHVDPDHLFRPSGQVARKRSQPWPTERKAFLA